jgi:hypothetical protein
MSQVNWQIYSVNTTDAIGYRWRWKCTRPDGTLMKASESSFKHYWECAEDAASHGMKLEIPRPPAGSGK